MTLKQFFRKARKGRTWGVHLNPFGAPVVRCEQGYCPLGAVIGNVKLPGRVASAEDLHMRGATTQKIADAADYADDRNRKWLLKNLGVGVGEDRPAL